MKIATAYPPNIEQVRSAFPLQKGVLFCYGDTIYNPDEVPIPLWLIAHETVHCMQQGENPQEWWDRYVKDPVFRYTQELDAHRAEWHAIKRVIKDRRARNKYLNNMAKRLSSPLYGCVVDFRTAKNAIRSLKPEKRSENRSSSD